MSRKAERMIFNYFETDKKLIYYEHGVDEIPDEIIAEYSVKDVTQVDFSLNTLVSLDCLSHFPRLKEVIFDNNFLSDSTIFPKTKFPKIILLSLNNNKLENLDQLLGNLSHSFPNLRYLSLLGNALCPALQQDFNEADYKQYRLAIISRLPKLMFLDAKRVDKNELSAVQLSAPIPHNNGHVEPQTTAERPTTSMERFSGIKKFFGFSTREIIAAVERADARDLYNPLPPDPDSSQSSQKSAYGKIKNAYEGAQSQGNRFILNQDL